MDFPAFIGLLGTGLAILTGAGLIRYGIKHQEAQDSVAIISAKDETILTWREQAEAYKSQAESQAKKLDEVLTELREAKMEVAHLRAEVETLKQFSAPAAIERFESKQEEMVGILYRIAEGLDGVPTRRSSDRATEYVRRGTNYPKGDVSDEREQGRA